MTRLTLADLRRAEYKLNLKRANRKPDPLCKHAQAHKQVTRALLTVVYRPAVTLAGVGVVERVDGPAGELVRTGDGDGQHCI